MDLRSILNASGISDANIPVKIEGTTFGQDVVYTGKTLHTLVATNDNDFDTSNAANTNKFFVFGIEATDLNYVPQTIAAVPEPETYAMLMAGLGFIGFTVRRRKKINFP